jgi:hypothetical protein
MSAFISWKRSLLVLLAALCAALAAALGLNYALAGPRLGPVYDFLLKRRPPPPVSREILLINTDEIVEGGDVFAVLMALNEMEAASLIIEAPVLGSSSVRIGSEEEIRQHFEDEYSLLGANIRNLFEAIRLGSVPPAESPAYVEDLVELAERGRDRLTDALINRDEAGVQAARAAAAFGNVLEARDLRSRPSGESPWYARPRPDPDGILRRVAPLLQEAGSGGAVEDLEHIVYHSLKPRWDESGLEYRERGPVLAVRKQGETDMAIPLDKDGNILAEKIREGQLRRIGLEPFRRYEEADRAMRQALKDAEAFGVYAAARPERIPPILWDYALGLREELLKEPDQGKRAAWLRARREYFASLEELLDGPAEESLTGGYDEIIATEELKNEGVEKLEKLRDDLTAAFAAMRERRRELLDIRNSLAETLAASFCVMGPEISGGPVESSALLANSLLTGGAVNAVQSRYALFWSLAAAFVILICIHRMGPLAALAAGLTGALICAAGFGWCFIISAYWIDPFLPAASCLAGTAIIFSARLVMIRRGARRFRLAYGTAVNRPILKALVRAGRPRLSETSAARAAIIAVKNSALSGTEDREGPLQAARAAAEFRGEVSRVFKKAGAVIVAWERDAVVACFGSPLERIYIGHTKTETRYGDDPKAASDHHPAVKAAGFIAELALPGGAVPEHWHFGIDCGDCAFSWCAETGYTASGRPVLRARLFAALAVRHKARVFITDQVRERLNQPVRRLSAKSQGGAGEYVYELPMRADKG